MSEAKRRLPYVLSLVIAAALLVESRGLDTWDVFGAGPGLFPRAVLVLVLAVSAALAAFPGLAEPRGAADDGAAPSERGPLRTIWLYVLSLPALAVASAWTGFIAMSVGTALLLTWLAEGRRLRAALAFGLIVGIVGVIGFGMLLDVNIPEDDLDRQIVRALR